jgi:hypothetical protein
MPILKKHEEAAVWVAGRVPSASSTPRRGCRGGGRLHGGERNARASLALRRQGVESQARVSSSRPSAWRREECTGFPGASLALRLQGVGEGEKDCCGGRDAMAAARTRRIRASAGEARTARSTAAAAGEATMA